MENGAAADCIGDEAAGAALAERLCRQLRETQPGHAAARCEIRHAGDEAAARIVLAETGGDGLLRILARQGRLTDLLAAHLESVAGVVCRRDPASGDELRIRIRADAPPDTSGRVAGILDALLEASARERADILFAPWTASRLPRGASSLDAAFAEDEASAPVVPDDVTLMEIWVPQNGAALARIDPRLIVYDDDDAEAVGRELARRLGPFRRRLPDLRINGRRIGREQICVPSADLARVGMPLPDLTPPELAGPRAPRRLAVRGPIFGAATRVGSHLLCRGAHAAAWLLEELLARAIREGGFAPGSAAVERAGAGGLAPERSEPAIITLVPPDADPASVPLRRNGVLIDPFGVMALRPRPDLLAKNILYIGGAEINGVNVAPAALEAALLELADPGARLGAEIHGPSDFAALAGRHGVEITALTGFWGVIDPIDWEAYRARRAGRLAPFEPAAGVIAARPVYATSSGRCDNLPELIFSPRHLAASSCLIDPASGERIGYAALFELATDNVARLRSLGLPHGAAVALIACDGVASVAVMTACFIGGWVYAPLNPTLPAAHIDSMLAVARPAMVLHEPDAAGLSPASAAAWPNMTLRAFVALPPRIAGRKDAASASVTGATPAVLLFTSGSAGRPKAVMHRHADFIACSRNYLPHVVGLRPEDRVYCPSPHFFAFGLNNLVLSLLAGAGHVLAAPLPAGVRMAEVIAAHDVSVFCAVPAVFKLMLMRWEPPPSFGSLRLCVSAGEKLSARLYRTVKAAFGVDILDGIGNTEALSTFIANRPDSSRPGCTGFPMPGFELRLVNEDGEPCRIGEPGVLWLRGATLAEGYIDGATCELAPFADGWCNTQDRFFMDADYRFYNLGRAGSAIKINGCWLSPQALEDVLETHPAVKECAICIVADEYDLPRPKAFVVIDDRHAPPAGNAALWRELRALSRDRQGKDIYPHLFAEVAALPRTASGKLIRSELSKLSEVERLR